MLGLEVLVYRGLHIVLDHLPHLALKILSPLEGEEAAIIDDLTLLVHDIVVVQQAFPRLEVVRLHPLLRGLDGARHHRVSDHLTLGGTQLVHGVRQAITDEQPHEVVLHRNEELGRPGITLPPGTAPKLTVDPSGLVPLGPEDLKPTHLNDEVVRFALELDLLRRIHGDQLREIQAALLRPPHRPAFNDTLTQLDVGSAAGHVRGDRHGAGLARLRHDLGFLLVLLGVQDIVRNSAALEHARQRLRDFDVRGPHEDGELHQVQPLDFVHERLILLSLGSENQIVPVVADDGTVGGDHEDVELVDLVELGLLGLRRSGHSGQLIVHPEVVLDGDRGERLRLTLDLHSFLGLHRLVESVAPAPARHLAAGELVDDHDLTTPADDVLLVFLEQGVRLEELMDDVDFLALGGVLGLDPGSHLPLGVDRKRLVFLDLAHRLGRVGYDEGLRIPWGEFVETCIGQVNRVALFVHGKEEQFVDFEQALFPHVVGLDLEDELLESGIFGKDFQKTLVAWAPAFGGQQLFAGFEFVAGFQLLLGRRDVFAHQAGLLLIQVADQRVVFLEGSRRVAAYGTRDDEGRTRFVDEDRVHLVYDRVPVPSLYPLLQGVHHVVPEIVEPELVVGAVGDVRPVARGALRGVGLVLVDAVDGETEVGVDVTHPLGVALCKVRVDRYQVRALTH